MNKDDFLRETQEFAQRWNEYFSTPESERDGDMDPLQIRVIKTCRTRGCAWEGLSEWVLLDVPGDGVYKVFCAGCTSAVEDLDPVLEDDEEYRLPVRYADGSSWLVGVE